MDDERVITNESLDALLESAAPPTTDISPQLEDELARIVVRSRIDQREALSPRRGRVMATIAIASAVVVGGAGAAAAATVDEWAWWATNPTGTVSYTLPSGKVCEQRLGEINSSDPALTAAARDYVGSVDILTTFDVDEAFHAAKADAQRYAADAQGQVGDPFVMPTDDELYETAVFNGITTALTAEMQAEGFSAETIGNAGLELSGQSRCADASQ